MSKYDKRNKPVQHDLRLPRALQPTSGWNPLIFQGKVVRFRCMNCGTLLGIAPRDMQGEFEHKCPVCGHVHVFNRRPQRWGTRHALDDSNLKMILKTIEGVLR